VFESGTHNKSSKPDVDIVYVGDIASRLWGSKTNTFWHIEKWFRIYSERDSSYFAEDDLSIIQCTRFFVAKWLLGHGVMERQ
jgi:hypothetical protein